MTTLMLPPSPNRLDRIAQLSDEELEAELTLATLTSRRHGRFELLLSERRRRAHARAKAARSA